MPCVSPERGSDGLLKFLSSHCVRVLIDDTQDGRGRNLGAMGVTGVPVYTLANVTFLSLTLHPFWCYIPPDATLSLMLHPPDATKPLMLHNP